MDDDIYNEIIKLEKISNNSIRVIENYQAIVEDMEDYFEEYIIYSHYFNDWDLQIEKLYNSINLLKNIFYQKYKLLEHIKLSA